MICNLSPAFPWNCALFVNVQVHVQWVMQKVNLYDKLLHYLFIYLFVDIVSEIDTDSSSFQHKLCSADLVYLVCGQQGCILNIWRDYLSEKSSFRWLILFVLYSLWLWLWQRFKSPQRRRLFCNDTSEDSAKRSCLECCSFAGWNSNNNRKHI